MALTQDTIDDIKFSVQTANDSLKVFGKTDISDSLLKHNLNHLLKAASAISSELNRRQIFKEQI